MKFSEIREEVFTTTNKLCDCNLIRLSAGNITLRDQDGNIAITPSGIKYDVMDPADIVVIDIDGNIIAGKEGLKPSSEYRLHISILRDLPEVNAVIHTHSLYAMTFASLGKEIPIVCIELLIAGGPIPVAPYCIPGSDEIGDSAAKIFLERPELKGLLMKNHGMVAIGASLDEAFSHTYDIETGAQVYYQAMQMGKPDLIPQEDVSFIRQKYNLVPDRPPLSS
jgi:ribulose-5-phosphate 4-epimerase/fuculose-1-phosphate aldolase